MDIAQLADTIYEDLNAQITAIWRTGESELAMTLECDDWHGGDHRHRFELRCTEVKDHHLSVGYVDDIDFKSEHPLLFEYTGRQGSLFFSSVPASAEQVFYELNDVVASRFAGWVEPSVLLHGTPRKIVERLGIGYGLLAQGPVSVLNELRTRLQHHLTTNVVESTRPPDPDLRVFIATGKWVICKNVHVTELHSK